jgi:UDP-hydrolysing UDP-N-acetyl-D-glucosamine 2-epimerase
VKRAIAVVTGSRADYGVLRPLLRRLAADRRVSLRLLVTGAHLSPAHGRTEREIRRDGFIPAARVPILGPGPLDARGVARALARATDGFSAVFARSRPDLLVLLGDRYEILGAAAAALVHRLPVAHLSGGKTTTGAIDESVRHAVTKLSQFHFTHNEEFRRRLLRMGERPERVFAHGSPLVDEIRSLARLPRAETLRRCGLAGLGPYLVVAWHPETLAARDPRADARAVLAGARLSGLELVIVAPGAEAGSAAVLAEMRRFAAASRARLVTHLPRPLFLNLLRHAEALVGNSSAGLTDAPSLGVPVVNAGGRQDGMLRSAGVRDCAVAAGAVARAVAAAISPAGRARARRATNPYGDGRAAPRIARELARLPLGPECARKPFYDGPRGKRAR